jgi:cytochrome c-type biogenesis protein CcmH
MFMLLTPALAVQPDEIMKDPALEARARALSAELRCLVCQNESIDDSTAPLARDLRLLVRERIAAGESNAQVKHFLVQRYGEFVLLKPPVSARTALLWAGPFLVLVGAGLTLWRSARRQQAQPVADLSPEEQKRLQERLQKRMGVTET